VARDLRFLVSATRILYELERSGDLVVNLAHSFNRIKGFSDSPHLRGMLERLVVESTGVLSKAITALGALDAEAGEALEAEDGVVDDLAAAFYAEVGRERNDLTLEVGIGLTRMGRFLERIADHGVNIGENTAYIVTAEFPGDTHLALRDES
jgi:phosphate transport system protein